MAGKVLDIKSVVGKLSLSELEKKLDQTVMGRGAVKLPAYYKSNLASIPTLEAYLGLVPGLEDELEAISTQHMMLESDYETLDRDLRVYQGALFDGLCFVFDTEKNTNIGLFTANLGLLNHLGVENDVGALVLKTNKQGYIKGFRIDTELVGDEFTYKAVNARVNLDCHSSSDDKRYYLIPYVCVLQYFKILQSLLMSGKTIFISQESSSGSVKERIVTYDKGYLSKFSDSTEFVESIEPKMFPLSGYAYLPVVGAPSLTSGLTRVDPIKLIEMRRATNADFTRLSIKKPENPVRGMLRDSLIVNGLMYVKEEDIGQFAAYIQALPRSNELLSGDCEKLTDGNIASYLHTLSDDELAQVEGIVPVTKKVDSMVAEIGTPRRASKEEIENLQSIVEDHVVKVTIQKSDCTMGSVFGTKNTEILSKIYGKRYFKKYESMAYRFGVFMKYCKGPKSIITGLKRAGFKQDETTVARLTELMERHDVKSDEFYETAKAYILETEGVSYKRSEASSNSKAKANPKMVSVRSLDAYLSAEGKPVNFIKNINIDNVLSCIIFEKEK